MAKLKYAVVLGRGIEGCGVTKCAVEFAKYSGAKIFATDDKKWPRRKSISHDFHEFTVANVAAATRVSEELNRDFDTVLFFSVPSVTHPVECQNNFALFIQSVKKPKALLQFDHKSQSIRRNAAFSFICSKMDLLFTHSLDNDFARFLKEKNVPTKLEKMILGFDFDSHREKYWKPIEYQESKTIRWIGRMSGWKNPVLMMNFHNQMLRHYGFITILEGLEASIGYEGILKQKVEGKFVDIDVVNKFRPRAERGETKDFEYGAEYPYCAPYLYPPYNNHECMERMSLSAFGSDLYELPARMYGNNIENCHAEVVASGAIPIFHKHFTDNIVHNVIGKEVSECSGSGTISLDKTTFDEASTLIISLSRTMSKRDEYRNMAFDFWKSHADIKISHNLIDKKMKQLIKNKNK